jgi:hypothetical protein
MKAREVIFICAGLVLALVLSGCLIEGFALAGIAGSAGPRALAPAPDPALLAAANQGIVLDAQLPVSPTTVPHYRVVSLDRYTGGTGTALSGKNSIPSVGEAPGLAEKALAAYGGLPADAILDTAEQNFLYQYNLATATSETMSPQYTLVTYRQYVNGTRVMNADLAVELGEGGELVGISGLWATLEPAGETPVISAEEALQKLRGGDLLLQPQCSIGGSHIVNVEQGYYILEGTREPWPPARVITPDTCIPVWAFSVVKPGAEIRPFPLLVDATAS